MTQPADYLAGPHSVRVPVLMSVPLADAVFEAALQDQESMGAWLRDAAARKLQARHAAQLDAAQAGQ